MDPPTINKVRKPWSTFRIRFMQEGPWMLFLCFFLVLQLVYFSLNYYSLLTSLSTNKLSTVFGLGLISRTAANLLFVHIALIFLPVCRVGWTWLRSLKVTIRTHVPGDMDIQFHRIIGIGYGIWSIVHVIGHYVNYIRVVGRSVDLNNTSNSLTGNVLYWLFVHPTGLTGHIILLGFILLLVGVMLRKRVYEVFWWLHWIGIVIMVPALLLHGGFCLLPNVVVAELGGAGKCEGNDDVWKWLLPGLCVYLLDRFIRLYRTYTPSHRGTLTKIIQHPSNVIELQFAFKRSRFNYLPGQYVLINVPVLSVSQWHPFTITSSPDDDDTKESTIFVSVHIRAIGNWTRKLYTLLTKPTIHKTVAPESNNEKATVIKRQQYQPIPYMFIDGPFGSTSQDVVFCSFRIRILIASGNGVNPFVSVLKSLYNRYHATSTDLKIHFIWICRQKESFEWFQQLLSSLESTSERGFDLFIHIYCTEGFELSDIQTLHYHTNASTDMITGLSSQTTFGRPRWDVLFTEWRELYPSEDIGVFFCGNERIAGGLRKSCGRFSESGKEGTRFFFWKGELLFYMWSF